MKLFLFITYVKIYPRIRTRVCRYLVSKLSLKSFTYATEFNIAVSFNIVSQVKIISNPNLL